MNSSAMPWSDIPACCIFQILVRAGLQKPHWPDDIIQLTSSEQLPHWHEMCRPARLTSSLMICDSVCARQRPATASNRRLVFHRCMLPRYTHHLRARVFAFHFAWHERHQRAEDQRKRADPDPGNQREDVGLNHRAVAVHAGKIEIQVLV